MKKIAIGIAAGVILLVSSLLISFIFQSLFPSVQAEYENTALFRLWSDPLMSFYFVEPFIVGMLLLWIWNKTKEIIPIKTDTLKGVCFGFIYWLITLPGMLMTYSSFQLSLTIIISWSIGILLGAIITGILFSKTIK